MPPVSPSRSRLLDRLILAAVPLVGIAALLRPDWVLAAAPPCLVTLATGHRCWGCGLTHAVLAVLRLDFRGAWQANPAVGVVLPLLLLAYVRFALGVLRDGRRRPRPLG